jgi:hypothetical protein
MTVFNTKVNTFKSVHRNCNSNNNYNSFSSSSSKSLTNSILRQALSTTHSLTKTPNNQGTTVNRINKNNATFKMVHTTSKLSEEVKKSSSFVMPLKNHRKVNLTWLEPNTDKEQQKNLFVTEDGKCVHFDSALCFQTRGVRTRQPLKRNVYTYWQVSVPEWCVASPGITSFMLGVGKRETTLECDDAYLNLLGSDTNSWALSHKGHTWHDNVSRPFSPAFYSPKNNNNSGMCTIGCLFDGFTGRLTYYKNGLPLGTAFHGLPLESNINSKDIDNDNANFQFTDLYPMVSTTVSDTVCHIECVYESFPTLKDLCRARIVQDSKASQIPYQIL